jgi:L-methionine (R)-S-oxide reductase
MCIFAVSKNIMAEDLHIIPGLSRKEAYANLLPQLTALVEDEKNMVANVGNLMAGLKETFGFHWVGCYFVEGDQLVLGPFQGPVACTRIAFGRGVCGSAWKDKKTLIVPDVDLFPGHIACSSLSRSEIVVPIFSQDGSNVIGVIDVDSVNPNDFSTTDQVYLEQIAHIITRIHPL